MSIFKNKVVENIMSLLILQGSNYILPLITFPYLVRTLGVSNYGLLIFMTSLMQYLIVFTDYGFNFSATRKVALIRNDGKILSEYCNLVFTIKLLFISISFLGLLLLLILVKTFSEYSSLYLVGFISVIGSAIFPIWFFQGIEKMKYITIVNIASKAISTVLIFLFIRDKSDYNLAAFFQSLNYLLPGLIGIYLLRKKFSVTFKIQLNRNTIAEEIKSGWHVFVGNISGNVYGQGAIFLVGLLAGKNAAGNYGICQKIVGATVGITQPFSQALYPFLCRKYEQEKIKFHEIKRKVTMVSGLIALLLGIFLFTFSDYCIQLVAGSTDSNVNMMLKMFSVLLILQVLNVQINPFILAANRLQQFQKMYVSVAIIFLIISIPLTLLLREFGMIVSILIVEFYILIVGLIIIRDVKRCQEGSQS